MKHFVEFCLGIIIALALYTFLGKIYFSLPQLINFFTLVVIYFALTKGKIYAACMGTVSGLIQDSFSLGVFGVSGLAKTIMGYSAGIISQKTNVLPFFRNFIFIFILICVEIIISLFFYYFIASEYVKDMGFLVFFQPLSNAFFGSFIFMFLRKIKIFKS
ncbi:MAG: rod shape-determining protein MreD [Candidatus Aminicenantaceae bacterium]